MLIQLYVERWACRLACLVYPPKCQPNCKGDTCDSNPITCSFWRGSLQDIVKAVGRHFRNFHRPITPNDKPECVVFSCILRFVQGTLAIQVTLLLVVVSSSNVIKIILIFIQLLISFWCLMRLASSSLFGLFLFQLIDSNSLTVSLPQARLDY